MTTLLICYNASGSMLGHAQYAYHHFRQTPGKDCSACALTHGPKLSLSESEGWAEIKRKLESGELGKPIQVKQLHTEDLDMEMTMYLKEHSMNLPCVLKQESDQLQTVFTKTELDEMKGDQAVFETRLKERLDT